MTALATSTPLAPVAPTPPPPLAPTNANAATKREWHAATSLNERRRVLLQILLLLKAKYGKVDTKISYIARRAELALYSQAFTLDEYCNARTLNRRLHSLVVKLHMNNLAAKEDRIFDVEGDGAGVPELLLNPPEGQRKRRANPESGASNATSKRLRGTSEEAATESESPLSFDGNRDLLHHVCSFLSVRDILQVAATNKVMHSVAPAFVTSIDVSAPSLESLSAAARTVFFDRFPELTHFGVHGDERSHLHFDFQNELALVRRNVVCRSLLVALTRCVLPKLERVHWHFAFVDGVHDRITSQIADVLLDPTRFPRLRELSLVGNAVSDDGVSFLCAALRRSARLKALRLLNLEQNFIGERGRSQLEQLTMDEETRCDGGKASALVLKLHGNLLMTSSA